MRRINLPLILDTLFAAFCAFLLFFTSIRYYTRSAYVALGFAIAAAILFGALSFLYISKKQNKKLLLARDEKHKTMLSLHLSLSSDAYILELMKKCLTQENEQCKVKNRAIIVADCAYFCNFKMQPLSEDDIARVIKVNCDEKKVIICNRICADALTLCKNFLIEVKQIDYIYELLKERHLLPEKYVYEGQKKIGFFCRIKARFSRKICAPLFWSGFALLILSYFTFFPVYYIVSGGLMLIASAVALVIN